jgi:hypothetical protein
MTGTTALILTRSGVSGPSGPSDRAGAMISNDGESMMAGRE